MTSNTASLTRRQLAPLPRLLVFVLLALVTYTTTADAVHRHGGFLPDRSANPAAAATQSGDADSSASHSRALGECLICQLQQHLFSGLLSALPQAIAPQALSAPPPASAPDSISRPHVSERGRAPPLASLI